MKKALLVFGILTALSLQSYSQQKVEITPMYGIHFGGRARFYEGDIDVQDNATYGINISVPTGWDTRGEFTFTRSDSRANFIAYKPGYENTQFDVASNYFLFGGVKEVGDEKLMGFGSLSLGMAWFDGKSARISDVFRFSFSLGAGFKIYITDKVGLKVQGRFLVPIYFAGGGMYCGIGTGGSSCGVSMAGGSAILQGDITGGIIIQLGD